MESSSCPACLSTEVVFAFPSRAKDFSEEGFRYFSCRECGGAFLNPLPTEREIARFYSRADLYVSPNEPKVSAAAKYLSSERFRRDREQYILPLLKHKASGKLLDFGCGEGWFTHHAQSAGFDSLGIDFTDRSLTIARNAFSGQFRQGGIHTLREMPGAEWDAIATLSTLEHLPDPGELLGQSARLLRPGGILMAAIPTVDSLQFRALGEHFYWAMAPYHVHLFSIAGFTRLLGRYGFSILEIVPIRTNWYWTKAVVDKLGVEDRYRVWREDPSFRVFDLFLDEILDKIAVSAGGASSVLVFAAKTNTFTRISSYVPQ